MKAKQNNLSKVEQHPERKDSYKKSGKVKLSTILLHFILVIGSIAMIGPFLWMVLSALKNTGQIFSIPPVWIPDPFVWENFPRSLQAMPFDRAYFNSVYISVLVVGSQIFTCSMAAYGFAKLPFRGSNVIFILFLATMMVPMQVTLIPLYLLMDTIGWLDSHLSIIVPSALFNAFGVFLLRQFIMGIPKEMEEAAVMDGANPLQIYWKIIMPLIHPALAAFGIFSFISIWNNFIQPLVFLTSRELFTVPLLLNYFKGLYVTDWSLMMAGATISVVPVLIVYIIAQKHIIEGITLTGMKG